MPLKFRYLRRTTLDAIGKACPVLWDHLIYAYMIENTRVYEPIFRN